MNLVDEFRDPALINQLSQRIGQLAEHLPKQLKIMEVCGGHTHTIARFGLAQLLPPQVSFLHGPGCPVCIMPRERIDHAIALARLDKHILVTLGDMIRVPGSSSSLQEERAAGRDIRAVHNPLDVITIARENPGSNVVFFAIGFETTTPMTAVLLETVIAQRLANVLFHINHVLVPPPLHAILAEPNQIDAFIAPSHVSVIAGANIYQSLVSKYGRPTVVAGFEPLDIMQSVAMLVGQVVNGICELQIQYRRSVDESGSARSQSYIDKYFCLADSFQWRGIGEIAHSSLRLRDEYSEFDAEQRYTNELPSEAKVDHRHCLCPQILRGAALPADCRLFARACTPQNPLEACMVSSEGACAAYYRYQPVPV